MTSPRWDPSLYLAFASDRMRPALDLLARIPLAEAEEVVDLGCGAGNVTVHLRDRFPGARITGVDSSQDMLAKAAEALPEATWQQADIGAWRPPTPPQVIYSNAALQWLGDHETLFPRLLDLLAPGGVLAVQMPHTHHGGWRGVLREMAAAAPWAAAFSGLGALTDRGHLLETAGYHRLLAPLSERLDIWETEYLHVLEGDDPVAQWTRGAALRPFLAALDEDQGAAFYEAYRARLREIYPPEPDGRTLLPFRRLFIIAGR
jgi:trans-aconitate 2-methyltransferase